MIEPARKATRWTTAAMTVLLIGCTAAPPTAAPPGTPVVPARSATADSATVVASTPSAAAAVPGERKEASFVRLPRPFLVSTIEALKKNDIATARAAFEGYDSAWNGVEVYVNFRSRQLYNELEQDLQATIEKQLEAAQPNAAEILPNAEAMLAKYEQAIKLSDAGPAISPLFDDVAAIRIARAELRKVGPALKANDIPRARAAYQAFDKRWDDVEDLIRLRSRDDYREIEDAMKKVDAAFKQERPSVAELTPLFDALTEHYNFGLSLVNAAARNADLGKTSFNADDVKSVATLGLIEAQLRTSLPLWEAAQYPDAAEHARSAANELSEVVGPPLKAKGADTALKKALDGYAALADKPGDAAKVRAANKSAIEAVALAEQTLVGQFWADPKLHGAIGVALLNSLRDDFGKLAAQSGPAPVRMSQTAWGILAVEQAEYRQIDARIKTDSPAQADAIARALGTLSEAFPDPVKLPATAPTTTAVTQAADAAAAGLKAALGLP